MASAFDPRDDDVADGQWIAFAPKRTQSAERLLDAAERLFAQRGVDATTVRDIALAAGQRNMSAVGYYFGTKAQLVDAVVRRRLPIIDRRRRELLAQDGDTVRGLVAAMLIPYAEILRDPAAVYYPKLLRHVRTLRRASLRTELSERPASFFVATRRLMEALPDLPPAVRELRVDAARHHLIDEVAFWSERLLEEGAFDLDLAVSNLVDEAVAALLAPCSEATLALARDGDAGTHGRTVRLGGP
jgi:AcrR family transcriptional regulator